MEKSGKTPKRRAADSPDLAARGSSAPASVIYAFDAFRIDVDATRLSRGDEALSLPSRAFDALVYLVEHRDRLVGKDEMVAAIWHDVAVTDDSLIHAISVLRRTIGDDRNDPRYIETIPRRGYRFIGTVTVVDSEPVATGHVHRRVHDAGHPARIPNLPGPQVPRRRNTDIRVVTGLAVLAALIAVLALRLFGTPSPVGNTQLVALRFSQPSPAGARLISGGALSPDGRYLAFVARDDTRGESSIWTRAMPSGEISRLDGTTDASNPFWAPDSRRIGFFANGKLAAVDVGTGQRRSIAPVGLTTAGGAWGEDGTILFAEWSNGLYCVPATGDGARVAIAGLDSSAGDISVSWPQFLPGSRRFLYHLTSLDPERTGTYVGDLDTRESYRLIATESPAVFAPPHYLLHVQNDMLIAEEIDPDRIELTGRAIVVARNVSPPSLGADDIVSASGNVLAFRNGHKEQDLAWLDRTGERMGIVQAPTMLYNPRISPDESQLLATSSITNDPGLWVASLSREEYARLEKDAIAPLWSPDGTSVAFTSRGGLDLLVRGLDSGGTKRMLVTDSTVKILNDWSPDGTHLIYTRAGKETGLDLWTTVIEGASAEPLLATPFSETQARISPDGSWMAYASDESGAFEVYLERYPGLGDKHRISTSGGGQPQWRPDQRELFYLSADRKLMAVDVRTGPHAAVELGRPRALFSAPIGGDPGDARDHYAVAANGTRFLIDGQSDGGGNAEIIILVNWMAGSVEPRLGAASLYQPDSPLSR